MIDQGEAVTNSLGVTSFRPGISPYRGRLTVCVSADVDGEPVSDCCIRPTHGRGVFGVVATHDTGTATVTALGGTIEPQRVDVVQGAFDVTSLASFAGRFVADLEASDGTTISRRFTKAVSPRTSRTTCWSSTRPFR